MHGEHKRIELVRTHNFCAISFFNHACCDCACKASFACADSAREKQIYALDVRELLNVFLHGRIELGKVLFFLLVTHAVEIAVRKREGRALIEFALDFEVLYVIVKGALAYFAVRFARVFAYRTYGLVLKVIFIKSVLFERVLI